MSRKEPQLVDKNLRKPEPPPAPPAIQEISAIKRMRLEPGDIIIVESESLLSNVTAEGIRNGIQAALPEKVRALILDGGLHLKILDASGIEK